jgi:pimeloyl-ACP methyl ester carboxylesterase
MLVTNNNGVRCVSSMAATPQMLVEDRIYVRFAELAYRSVVPLYIAFNDTDLPECYLDWDVLDTFDYNAVGVALQSRFYLNKCRTQFIITYRGTETSFNSATLYNWLADFDIIMSKYPFTPNFGEVHNGFLSYYQLGRDYQWNLLEQVLTNYTTVTQIVFTGHSLGAGIATLAAIDTRENLQIAKNYPNLNNLDAISMKIRTFGSPRVGNQQFANTFDQLMPQSRRYVTAFGPSTADQDVITGEPPSTLGYVQVEEMYTVNCPFYHDAVMCHKIENYWAAFDPNYEMWNNYFNQYSTAINDTINGSGPSFKSSYPTVMPTLIITTLFALMCL